MADSLFFTVIVCTRNRAASLGRMLETVVIAASRIREDWELIVVDNGSTDKTPEVVERFTGRLPVRRVWQPVAGISHARNAGVAAARGDYMLWTDDDVAVDGDWLAAWVRAFRARPGDAVFGGRTEPLYEEPHQPWFKANEKLLASLLAIRDEPDWHEVTTSRIPYGLNYAVRGLEQRRHPYDPELGVAPGRRRGGEETTVLRAILAEGATGSWVWDATVFHIIPAERQSTRYIRTFYEAWGYDFPLAGKRYNFIGRPRRLWQALRVLVKSDLAYRRTYRTDPAAAVPWLVQSARARGSCRRYLGLKGS